MADFGISYQFEIIDKFTAVAKKIETATGKMEKAVTRLADKTGKVSSKFKDFGEGLVKVGKKMTTHISAPLGIVAGLALKHAAAFDMAMRRTGAITHATAKQYAALKRQALDLATKTKFSADIIANSQRIAFARLQNVNDVLKTMPIAAKLALATQSDLAATTEVSTMIMKAYAVDASKIPEIMNMMTKAYEETGGSITSIGKAFRYAGPAAKMAGVSFAEAAAIIIMTQKVEPAATAGRQLRMAFRGLVDPTKKARKVLREMAGVLHMTSISFTDAHGKLVPFNKILSLFAKSHITLTGLTKLFNARAAEMINILIQGRKGFEKLSVDLSGSGSDMDKLAKIQMTGLQGSMFRLSSALKVLEIKFINIQGRPIQGVVNRLSNMIDKLDMASPATKKLTFGLIDAAIITGPVVVGVGKIILAIGILSGKVTSLTTGLEFLGSAFRFLFTGAIPILGTIITLTLLFRYLYMNFKVVRDITHRWRNDLLDILGPLKSLIALIKELHRRKMFGLEHLDPAIAYIKKLWKPTGAPAPIAAHATATAGIPLGFRGMQQQIKSSLDITVHDQAGHVKSVSGESDGAMNFNLGTNMSYSRV